MRREEEEEDTDAVDQLAVALTKTTLEVADSVSRPRKVLLVLDLNGLLIDRLHTKDLKQDEQRAPFLKTAEKKGAFYAWKRPHLDSFLDFCFENFDVACWSSVMAHNIDILSNWVFNGRKRAFTWHQDKCNVQKPHPDPTVKKKKPLFKKPLQKVWDSHPQYNESNTLLIDDTVWKAMDNPPHLLYSPKEWTVFCTDPAIVNALAPDGEVRKFLQRLAASNQPVAEFIKANTEAESKL